ncbi:hypothetical protein KM043_011617 [Ampulex compressa]|nr:hypothetical protein KM043_011617 [Ampulex compressa]
MLKYSTVLFPYPSGVDSSRFPLRRKLSLPPPCSVEKCRGTGNYGARGRTKGDAARRGLNFRLTRGLWARTPNLTLHGDHERIVQLLRRGNFVTSFDHPSWSVRGCKASSNNPSCSLVHVPYTALECCNPVAIARERCLEGVTVESGEDRRFDGSHGVGRLDVKACLLGARRKEIHDSTTPITRGTRRDCESTRCASTSRIGGGSGGAVGRPMTGRLLRLRESKMRMGLFDIHDTAATPENDNAPTTASSILSPPFAPAHQEVDEINETAAKQRRLDKSQKSEARPEVMDLEARTGNEARLAQKCSFEKERHRDLFVKRNQSAILGFRAMQGRGFIEPSASGGLKEKGKKKEEEGRITDTLSQARDHPADTPRGQ